jgi:integrase
MNDTVLRANHPALTGWTGVDRQLEQAREQLAAARHTEQFQAVGLLCREVLISLAQVVFVRERHRPLDGVEPSTSDSKRMLQAYVATELRGDAKEEERKHAQSLLDLAHSALGLANKVQHSRNADFRRAAMCVEATSSIVSVIAITAGRTETQLSVADLVARYTSEMELGASHRYSLQLLARMPIGKKLASKLRPVDVVDHCQLRRDANIAPPTVWQDLVFLRILLMAARDTWKLDVAADAVDLAKPLLEKAQIISKSRPRTRRPTREELARLVTHFAEREKDPRTRIPMNEITEFALWSARRVAEICSLRWDDLDETKRRCIVRNIKSVKNKKGRDHEFPLLGKAWEIVQRQKRQSDRIFPYNSHSISACYTKAKKDLGITNLTFNDLRREAAKRLFEAGYGFEQVAEVTGLQHLDPLYRELTGSVAEDKAASSSSN